MTEPVGFGTHRIEPPLGTSHAEWMKRRRAMLHRVLKLRTTVAFVGAGCSVPLGYPTWKGLTMAMIGETRKKLASCSDDLGTPLSADIETLDRFEHELEGGTGYEADRLMFMLGACQGMFKKRRSGAEFNDCLGRIFEPKEGRQTVPNPHAALLELPISRFITSNYDSELERALMEHRKIAQTELRLGAPDDSEGVRYRSFTQKPEYHDQLSLFSLPRSEEAANMVFHCHGRYDDPDSLVVTESDYQHWYLADESEGGIAFRQAIDLLFGSSPILFVGYGLGDEDLLRPLRRFVAIKPERKASRPLFALMPEPEYARKEIWDEHDQLYDRYGLNVVTYQSSGSQDPAVRGEELSSALRVLNQEWKAWWRGWVEKPVLRKVVVNATPPRPYQHYAVVHQTGERQLGGTRIENLLNDLEHTVVSGASRVVALIGPGGTGKSWLATQLMQRLVGRRDGMDGFFFWSSYYADDYLTGLDRALRYLDRTDNSEGQRNDRLLEALKGGRYFLIFDGIERILQQSDVPTQGHAYSWGVREFFKTIANPSGNSTVLLTSRLWPDVFDLPELQPAAIKRCKVPRFTTDEIFGAAPFSWFSEHKEKISGLCALLDGHIYGLVLAGYLIEQAGLENSSRRMEEIMHLLSQVPPDRRVTRVIREVISSIDKHWDGLAMEVLSRLAVFMSPVAEQTLHVCCQLAINSHTPRSSVITKDDLTTLMIPALLESRILRKVESGPEEHDPPAYTVHPVVRGYVFERVQRSGTDALPNFRLPGFTSGTADVYPGSFESARVVVDTFEGLRAACEKARQDEKFEDARLLCRSTFGLVRSRMESNTAPRWCSYDRYSKILTTLMNLTRKVSPRTWAHADMRDPWVFEDPAGILYADEIAWLYNDLGLVVYAEGSMLDSFAIWDQGYEINRVTDSQEEGGQYTIQSLLHIGHGNIEYGRLDNAERYLQAAELVNLRLKDPDYEGRITGYLGLVAHLRGNLEDAAALYQRALKIVRSVRRNSRAESIFLHHYANLKNKLGLADEAVSYNRTSRALAEAGKYPDLVAYARLDLGHILRSQGKLKDALPEYTAALDEARRIGIRKLEADVLSEMARLALDLGDAVVARQRSIDSLHIANELMLGLRQTHGLVVLGLAMIKAGQRGLGIAHLRHAKNLADRQQYWLRGREAEDNLHLLGESIRADEILR